MAIYRQVHVSFWQDPFVLDLTPEEKYFYLYLMTNSKTTQCGIYELPLKVIEMETGYNRETVQKLIERFEDYGKIKYENSTKEVLLYNWIKYNSMLSPKVMACVIKELQNIKNPQFIEVFHTLSEQYGYSIESLPDPYREEEEQEEEQEQKEEKKIPYVEIVDHLNQSTNQSYRATTKKTRQLIKVRWDEGFRLDDFKQVIDNQTIKWLNDAKMNEYLRPETLFGTKFESYLNHKPKPIPTTTYGNGFSSEKERIRQKYRKAGLK